MENHTTVGGLGTCVAELIAKKGLPKKLIKIAINDTYLHGASRDYLMNEYKIRQKWERRSFKCKTVEEKKDRY